MPKKTVKPSAEVERVALDKFFDLHLYGGHPAVTRGFTFDKNALDWCDTCVLVLPCGRSAHLEAGYACGQGKFVLAYLTPERFEPELMYLLGNGCVASIESLLQMLEHGASKQPGICPTTAETQTNSEGLKD